MRNLVCPSCGNSWENENGVRMIIREKSFVLVCAGCLQEYKVEMK